MSFSSFFTNFLYIIKAVLSTLIIAVILIPVIAIFDFLIVKSISSLFKDFKYADKSGRIIIVVASIIVLLQKIGEWTR